MQSQISSPVEHTWAMVEGSSFIVFMLLIFYQSLIQLYFREDYVVLTCPLL